MLINVMEDIFNLEVKNMTDLQAQHEIGYSEGHEQGFADGIEKGFAEGSLEERSKIAKSLYANGVPLEIIMRCSGFSEEEIKNL
jgi:predicted transposase/invertase (TIGR01784 family)